MSADNILVIFQHRGKIRVHDVNFSDISSHADWNFPMTLEKSKRLTDYILNSKYYFEVHKCNTVDQAIGFCKRYAREQIVEYGHTSIIAEEGK